MRAVVCKEFGPPETLVVETVDDPASGNGQVVVEVHAAGVNFPDTLIIQNRYQLKPSLPFSPGGEVAGVVVEAGPGVDSPKVGEQVIAMTGFGGFAERVVVPAQATMPVPDGMDLAVAAGFPTTYGTSYYALRDRAEIQPGETLLVLGAAGGVGLSAVELGAAMGAVVIAAASSDEKLELCRRTGAAMTINYVTEDLKERAKALTGARGVDVVYDPVGGDLSEPALRAMAWGGRFLVIGFAAGTIPRLPLNLLLLKSVSAVGVFWGAFVARQRDDHLRNMAEMAELWRAGKLKPLVSRTYPLEQAADALAELTARRATGKIVLLTDAGRGAGAGASVEARAAR